jgi:hypothetical protein
MLESLEVERVGYTKSLKIGDIVGYHSATYVLIEISSVAVVSAQNGPLMSAKIIVQKVGSKMISKSGFQSSQILKASIREDTRKLSNRQFTKTVGIVERNPNSGVLYRVAGIEKLYYDFTDLIVNYWVQEIPEWSDQEINKVLKEDKLNKFKVINGGSNE